MAKINDFYRTSKPFMDQLEATKRKAAKPSGDLRAQVLAQEASKRQCQGLHTDPGAAALAQMDVQQQQAGMATGPQTDFSGFFQQLKEEKQPCQGPVHAELPRFDQQQAAVTGRQEQQQQLPQQQQQQQGLGLLDQLLAQHSLTSAPAPQQELQVMMSLDRTFQGDASRDGFMRGLDQQAQHTSAASAAAGTSSRAGSGLAAPERWHLPQLQQLPWDWSVKQRVRLASPAPFALLEQRRRAGWEPGGGVEPAGQCADTAESEQARLAAALVQFQFPGAPLGPGLLAAVRAAGDKEGAPAWISDRVNTWRDALRDAFLQVRSGACPALYVVGQACRQQFVAVFCCAGVLDSGGGSGLVAVVSRTNRPLREVFAAHGAEGLLAGSLEQHHHQHHPQQQERPHATAAFDGQPGSQLLLCGALQVHGLYAALLSLPWCGPEQPDVPLLLAPVLFRNASSTRLRLELLPDAVLEQQQLQQPARALSGDALQQQQQQHPHYAELTAPSSAVISPWAVHRLGQLLLQTQGAAGFDMFLETEASSSSLNVLPGAWQQAAAAQLAAAMPGVSGATAAAAVAQAAAAAAQQQNQQQLRQQQRAGFSAQEQRSWQESLVLLQGRVLKQLRVAGEGREMAARLA